MDLELPLDCTFTDCDTDKGIEEASLNKNKNQQQDVVGIQQAYFGGAISA